jgi:hypothetical protein
MLVCIGVVDVDVGASIRRRHVESGKTPRR